MVAESLVDAGVVLPVGLVCDPCNHGVLSDLDNYAQSSIFALQRIWFRPTMTKQGKWPRRDFQNARLERIDEGNVHFAALDKTGRARVEELPDGSVRVTFTARMHLDHVKVGRWLLRVGLGFVAWKRGRNVALDQRFDAARNAVLRDEMFHNTWLLQALPPGEGHSIRFWDLPGTPFVFEALGYKFGFCLEEMPRADDHPLAHSLENTAWFPMDGPREEFKISSPDSTSE